MGIERFFSSIEQNDITNLKGAFTQKLGKQIPASYFLIDFNSVVYITSFKILSDLNYLLYRIIKGDLDGQANKIMVEYDILQGDVKDLKTFKDHFDPETLETMIISNVLTYVKNAVQNYIVPDKLKVLYIAIDGVPSMGKMTEQKKRRYMGAFQMLLKKKIFNKYENELKKNSDRYEFETNKISWKTTNITPGTPFMHKLVKGLRSTQFYLGLKDVCPNLEEYIFNGPYEPGEGENKIVNYLRGLEQTKDDYVIYSPDSDVTLLGLILNAEFRGRKISKLTLLRHNQQKNNYDVVDVDLLATNLYTFVRELTSPKIPHQDSVILDIVFLLSVFGNDFVPKLNSLDVRTDFTRLIKEYASLVKKTEGDSYLIRYSDSTQRRVINQSFFLDLLEILKTDEGGSLQKVYMAKNYYNYRRLKKMMGANDSNFTQILGDFLENIRDFHEQVEKSDNKKKVVEKWLKQDDFVTKLRKLTRMGKGKNNNDFLYSYVEQHTRSGRFPYVGIGFMRSKRSLEDQWHAGRLSRKLDNIDQSLPITQYDEEMYKFDSMVDEYVQKLNGEPINLGYIGIDLKTYTFKTEKIIKGVQRYYDDFFGIKDISINNPKMKNLLQGYIDGLMWVFEYYFNNFDEEYHRKAGERFYYRYNHAPLLTQLYFYFKQRATEKNYLRSVSQKLYEMRVPRQHYFNTLEQMMYVTPKEILVDIAPEEYRQFIKTSGYYPDMQESVDAIFKGDNGSEYIDCRGVIFVTKCHLEVADNNPKPKHFINDLRKIKLKPETEERKNTYQKGFDNIDVFKYSDLTTLDKVKKKD